MTDFLKDDLYRQNLLEQMRNQGNLPVQPPAPVQEKAEEAEEVEQQPDHRAESDAGWTADNLEDYGE